MVDSVAEARELLESMRTGLCPRCGSDRTDLYADSPGPITDSTRLSWRCAACAWGRELL